MIVATPDIHTGQVELKDFNNPEFSQTTMLSDGVLKELREAEETVRRRLQGARAFTKSPWVPQPLVPCGWYCTETLYHPGHLDNSCFQWCTIGCGVLGDPLLYVICVAGCYGACWVPSWTECVTWEWLCGLP